MRYLAATAFSSFILLIASPARTFAATPSLQPPLVLVNANTGAQIPFINGVNLEPSQGNLWFVIAKANAATSSMQFQLDADLPTIDNRSPFTSQPGLPARGAHSLIVTPCPRKNGAGAAGQSITITFTVANVEPTPIPSPSASPTPDPTPSPTATPLPTPAPTPTPTPTPSPTPTATPTPTPEPSPTPTPSPSPSLTPDPSPTITPTPSPMPTPTPTPTGTPSGHTITALTCSAADVQSAINQAADGDIVSVGPGTATWGPSTGVPAVIIPSNKAITLRGAGSGAGGTRIIDGRTSGSVLTVNARSGGLATDKITRVTGFDFEPGTVTTGTPNKPFQWLGTDQLTDGWVRWDHCVIGDGERLQDCIMQTVRGVFDHLTATHFHFYPWDKFWHDPVTGYSTNSDGSFAAPINWGTTDWLYIEHCNFIGAGGGTGVGLTDSYYGGRLVFRFNTVTGGGCLLSHGTETGGGRGRGLCAFDIYGNSFDGVYLAPKTGQASGVLVDMRSGVIRFHDNTMTHWGSPVIVAHTYRYWVDVANVGSVDGIADSYNPVDVNDFSGGPGSDGIYFSSAAATSGSLTLTVSPSPNWSINKWKGYVIKKTDHLSTDQKVNQNSAIITASTANSLIWHSGFDSHDLLMSPGDGFQIRRITQLLDQFGRAGGTLTGIIGLFGGVTDPKLNPNDQITVKCYSWGNTPAVPFQVAESQNIVAGIHYVNDNTAAAPGYSTLADPHPLTLK